MALLLVVYSADQKYPLMSIASSNSYDVLDFIEKRKNFISGLHEINEMIPDMYVQ